jgi:hypothetical protein
VFRAGPDGDAVEPSLTIVEVARVRDVERSANMRRDPPILVPAIKT